MSRASTSALRVSAALLAMGAVPAGAASLPPPSAAPAPPPIIKHLPAGHDELVFRGEAAHRRWSVYLGRGEIERARTFQAALRNTVALLPERSSVRISVNGHLLDSLQPRSPGGVTLVPLAIPPGLLVPGFNTVEVDVAMTHRVDCSVDATYELWTLLDPARTGFVLSPAPRGPVRAVEDVAAEALAEDGTTRIRLRAPEPGDAAGLGRAGTFLQALVRRAGLVRPVVDVDGPGGRGPGFDVLLTTAGAREEPMRSLVVVGRDDGVTFARDPATDRLVLVVSGTDEADLDRQVAAFAAKDARATRPAPAGEMTVDGETRRTFADLGLPAQRFTGRHYGSTIDIVLPGDFYPANYDKAQILVDGAYAANIDAASELVFRVNGALVSSLKLDPDRGGTLRHEAVELPLRFFHPGHNAVVLDATTRTAADQQCDAAATAKDVRLALAGSTEIAFPRFAHLGTVPQIPGAMAGPGGGPDGGVLDVYLPKPDAASAGAALTILANMATERGEIRRPAVHPDTPAEGDAPGLVVAPYDALPSALSASVRSVMALPGRDQPAGSTMDDGIKGSFAADEVGGPLAVERDPADAEDPPTPSAPRRVLAAVRQALKSQGFFFGADRGGDAVPFSSHALMVAAVEPRPADRGAVDLDLPRFAADAAQWLVFTAADDDTLRAGLARLVSDGQWGALDGRAVSLDLENGRTASVQPSRVLYVLPHRVVPSDLRPILGGIVSNHIAFSLVVLVLLMGLLGLSTHALIRRAGVR